MAFNFIQAEADLKIKRDLDNYEKYLNIHHEENPLVIPLTFKEYHGYEVIFHLNGHIQININDKL